MDIYSAGNVSLSLPNKIKASFGGSGYLGNECNIHIEGIKHWGIVGGKERPFEKQAEKLFNLFLDKAEQFLNSEVEK